MADTDSYNISPNVSNKIIFLMEYIPRIKGIAKAAAATAAAAFALTGLSWHIRRRKALWAEAWKQTVRRMRMEREVLLQMTDICKEFPGVKALTTSL